MFRCSSIETRRGGYFEGLATAYLKYDLGQAGFYSDVEAYATWAKAHGLSAKETRIDLVTRLRDGDGYAAIQCKFYASGHTISKSEIDSFLAASGKETFRSRVVIDTAETPWGTTLNPRLLVNRIDLHEMRKSRINWADYKPSGQVTLKPPKEPRPHQVEAIDAVAEGFATHDRGRLIMDCRTGKTFTALKIAERVVGLGKRVLILFPSLALIAQTVRGWSADSEPLCMFIMFICGLLSVASR